MEPLAFSVLQVFVSAPFSPRAQHFNSPLLSLLHVPEQHVDPLVLVQDAPSSVQFVLMVIGIDGIDVLTPPQ